MNNARHRLEFDKVLERIAQYASFSLSKEAVLSADASYSKLTVKRDLKRMHDALQCVNHNGSFGFAGISDIAPIVNHASKSAILGVEEIVQVGRFIRGVQVLKKQFDEFEGDYPNLVDLFEALMPLDALYQSIYKVVGDTSQILDGASALLRQTRQDIRRMESNIDAKTQDFLNKNKSMLAEPIVSLQQGRQTFLIKPSEKNKMDGTIYGSSASGQSLYFEPAFLSKHHNELNQLKHTESMEIERICLEISLEIKDEAHSLYSNLETVTLIDTLNAKAAWGVKNDAVVAHLSDDRLNITHARHPLIDPKLVVSNSFRMEPPHKMILISGPNTGGKSVSLKTMGLSVMMTLAGCPILAEKAEIMMVDQIFVDIGDQQSIEKSLSSFSAHLETMTQVSQSATDKSLVLLDELGSQTDPLEGESLSMAILDHFRNIGCWVVATTHFSRLKQYGTKHDDIMVSSVEFDIKNLKPTYRYRENVLGESNAFAIAKRLGLSGNIIDQAFKYKQEGQYEADHMMEILEARIQEAEDLKKTLKKQEMQQQSALDALHKEQERVAKSLEEERLLLLEANDEILQEKLAEANKILESMKTTVRPDERQKAVKKLGSMTREVSVDKTLSVGDRVQLKATQQIGVIEAIEKKTAFITIGGLKVSMDLSKITKVGGPVQNVKKKKPRTHSVTTLSSFQQEINVIGMRVAEALPMVEKYIDECVVHNLTTCRVVHGHGTGTLRSAIHDMLRRNKHVRKFELASFSEGGAGATVVNLK